MELRPAHNSAVTHFMQFAEHPRGGFHINFNAAGMRESREVRAQPPNLDAFARAMRERPNEFPYRDSRRFLDARGRATAVLTIPPNASRSLAGTVHHAFALPTRHSEYDVVSNAVALELTR